MSDRSKGVMATVACCLVLLMGCNAKQAEGPDTQREVGGPIQPNLPSLSLTGGWQCKHPMKNAPGFFYRSYHFGADNVFATYGEDGSNTVWVAGAYQLNDGEQGQQTLRWIEGAMTAFSPRGEALFDWHTSKPGGRVMASNFRDRQTQVRVIDANNIILKPISITSGPGGEIAQPNPPNEYPCVRKSDTIAERVWNAVPRPVIGEMLSLYPLNPIPMLDLSQAGPQRNTQTGPSPSVTAAMEGVSAAVQRMQAAIESYESTPGCEAGLRVLYKLRADANSMWNSAQQVSTDESRVRFLNAAERTANSAGNLAKGTVCNP